MAKELPYFQFESAEWMAGSIQLCSMIAQGLFINVLALYWQRSCILTVSQVNKRYKLPEQLTELIDENIIKVTGEKIQIEFLDKQFEIIGLITEKKRQGGINSALKRKQEMNTPDKTLTKTPPTIREDKIREDKIRGKKVEANFQPPCLDDVKKYFSENGYSEQAAATAFKYYHESNWVDSKGNKVRNWKQKMIAVWFKPESKDQSEKRRGLVN